jgi:hypothetical protein
MVFSKLEAVNSCPPDHNISMNDDNIVTYTLIARQHVGKRVVVKTNSS